MIEPKRRNLTKRCREVRKPVRIAQQSDRFALRRRRIDGAFDIGGLGIHQPPNAVLGIFDGANVRQAKDGTVRADDREKIHDRFEVL